ncbi:hypothetical protein OQA88_3196 [Cercophora sp. LCS_1]
MVQNGTSTKFTNETIQQSRYFGPVAGLYNFINRTEYLTLTYQGCLQLCGGDKAELYDATKALGIAATWIFPLAILLSLPYDSPLSRRLKTAAVATSNWLGSPQTALGATLFNFRQIQRCHQEARMAGGDGPAKDTYFILSCLNQFDLPEPAQRRETLNVLMYGLFRPLSAAVDGLELDLLRDLQHDLAHALRMLRRRGVVPVALSLLTFLAAFVFSIVLAFYDLGENSTAHSLALGILFGWLPVLVCYNIADRNPVSAERTIELVNRWLYNVAAVRTWHQNNQQQPHPAWWGLSDVGQEDMRFGDFVGQGRTIRYTGLARAVLVKHRDHRHLRDDIASYDNFAAAVQQHLEGAVRGSWIFYSLISLGMVWLQVGMAFIISYHTPTVGLGCRSLSFTIYGGLTTVTWLISFLTLGVFGHHLGRFHLPRGLSWAAHVFNMVALLGAAAIIGFQLTGGMNNCFCKSSVFAAPLGGYMDFEGTDFYKAYFNVERYWGIGTAFGAIAPFAACFWAIATWWGIGDLWTAPEQIQQHPMVALRMHSNTDWLK